MGAASLGTLERLRRGAARHGYHPEPQVVAAGSPGVSTRNSNTRRKLRNREPSLLGEVFADFYANRSVAKKLLLPQIAESWVQIVGELVAEHSNPKRIEEDTLLVSADSSVWAAQLTALSPLVVSRITEITGSNDIYRVQVSGPKANVPNYGPRKAKGAIGYRDTFG